MVEEQEVRLRLLCLLEDLMQRRERDQHPASLRSYPSDLEPAVVPALGERAGGYLLYSLRYVSHARHARSALYNPRGSEPCAQASSTDLRRHPPATPRRTALSRCRSAGRRIARPPVGSPLPVPDERALARLPRVPGALWQGPRPAQHPPIRAGASPACGSRTHVGTFVIVTLLGAPAPLRAALLSYALATLLFALLTPFTNLSLHVAGVSGAAVCLIYVFGVWGLPAVILVPLVWWARTILGRHTPAELAVGVLVGGGATLAAFQLI